MDFITCLPEVQGRDFICVVVDRLMKFAHFFAIISTYKMIKVVELFFREISGVHGLPQTIASDQDNMFMSLFWQELFRLCGTELASSTGCAQTDRENE